MRCRSCKVTWPEYFYLATGFEPYFGIAPRDFEYKRTSRRFELPIVLATSYIYHLELVSILQIFSLLLFVDQICHLMFVLAPSVVACRLDWVSS